MTDTQTTKEILTEVSQKVNYECGINPTNPFTFKQVLSNDKIFRPYINGLAETIESKRDQKDFKILAENTRFKLLENSMFQANPYETLTMPILRVFYPKFVGKEAVTVSPMDKPETIKAFLRAKFTPSNSTTQYDAPVTSRDITQGASIGTPISASIPVPSNNFDVLGVIGLTSSDAHLERDFTITGVSTDGTAFIDVSIIPAIEGHFSQSVTIGSSPDVITGKVDYLNGTVDVANVNNVVKYIRYETTTSLEENKVNPTVQLYMDKVRLNAKDRQLTAEWSINYEQDARALFDLSLQAEVVNVMGQQIALDIDREIINSLITANSRLNAASHRRAFAKNPPAWYTWGIKYWHENVIYDLNTLSAKIYDDTNMDSGNTILAHPLDVVILEDLQNFQYTGTSVNDGDLGYRSATVAGGKWKIFTSNVVPQGTMLMTYKPQDEIKCVYIYAPYVPAVLHPYPLGPKPSLTILSRYATTLVRSNGIAVLNVT